MNGCPALPPVYVGRFDLGDDRYSPLGIPQRKPPHLTLFAADANARMIRIRWTGWGTPRATGKGTAETNMCRPSCVERRFVRRPGARVVLYRLRGGDCRGQPALFYTRAQFTWPRDVRLRRLVVKLVGGCGRS